MHPRLSELLAHLDAEHRHLHDELARIPAMHRNMRPAAGRWSVAEIVEHLALIEARVAAMLTAQVAAARAAGVAPDPDHSAVIPTLGLERVTRRSDPITAPPPVTPRDVVDLDSALAHLRESHQLLLDAVRGADGVNLAELSSPHPLFGPLSLYHWIGFTAAHERRHAAQIAEVRGALASA